MRKVLSIIILLSALLSFGQNKDQKASALLDDLSAKTKASKSIKAEFTYSMYNEKAKINEEKTGSLLLSGNKYKMNAAGRIIFCDGKTIWTYIEKSNEVQISSLEDSDDSMTPSKLLSSYNENYKSKIIRDKKQDANTELIELIPNKQKNIVRAILGIDKAKTQVKSFTLFDKNGSTYTYKITRYQTDIPVTNSDFTFDSAKFPGVDIQDLR